MHNEIPEAHEPSFGGRAPLRAGEGLSADPPGFLGSGGLKLLAEIGLLALVYFVTARLGQLLAIPPGNITPVWIPSGIILAAVLARGYRVWPGIFLGAFMGNIWAYFSAESIGAMLRCILAGTANGIGDTLCAVGGAYLITRTTGGRDIFGRAADVIKFIVFGGLVGSGVSALFGVTALVLTGFATWQHYLSSLATWWTGDAVGVIVITPMLLVWRAGWRGCRFGWEELLFAVLLPTASLASWLLVPAMPMLVILPLLLWAVFRFDRRILLAAILVEAGLTVVVTALDGGPFASGKSSAVMMNLQLFLTLMSAPMLVLCGALSEGAQARDQLLKLKHDAEQHVQDSAQRLMEDLVEQQRLPKPAAGQMEWLAGARSRWVGLAVLLAGLISTAVAAYWARPIVDATANREFGFDRQEIQDRIVNRLTAHELVLRSGAAFFGHATNISRQEWRGFVERQNVEQQLSGIQGVGFAKLISPAKLAQHIQEVRAEGFPDYHVRPPGEREDYSAIVYLEPLSGRNLRAFGYDMLSEPVRRLAMERARDFNAATISGKVRLVQETAEDVQAGALMFVPVYRVGMPIETVDQRRAALQGWVYSPYRMADLMRGILGEWDLMTDRRIRLEIFDGERPAPADLLYDSQPASGRPEEADRQLVLQNHVVVAGRPWTLQFTRTGNQTVSVSYVKVWLVLFGGTISSLLVCGLTYSLVKTRLAAKQMSQQLAAELRQSEAQTLATARLLQAVIDHSHSLVYVKDLDGRHILASQPLAKFFGQSSYEQVLGKTLHDLLPPAIADQFRANELEVMAQRSSIQTEETAETADGPQTFLSTKFPIFDAKHRVHAVGGVSFDITARKRMEKALQESEAHYRSLMEEAVESKNALETVNLKLKEQIRERHRAEEEVRQANAGLEQRVGERTAQLADANRTLSHRAISLEVSIKELDAFSYSISHDLRAPLRHIGGYVGLLRNSAGPSLAEKSRRYLDEITGSAAQMGKLIDDLLIFSRMGRAQMRPQRFELAELVEESICQLKSEINGRNILWKRGPLPTVQADPALVRQVLINLLSNAIKYTRPRDPATIEIGCTSETGEEMVVFVRDNGVGFDMNYSNKLFGVFQRLHADDEFEGTGIGLANVRRIIARHGGRTWAEGKVDVGATFYFSLPVLPPTSANSGINQTVAADESRRTSHDPESLAPTAVGGYGAGGL